MSEQKKIGLIAGKGEFPLMLARAATDQGYQVEAFGLINITGPEIEQAAPHVTWLHLGQFTQMVEVCRELGITALAMAGHVPHTAIFHYRGFDQRTLSVLKKAASLKTDSLLGAVCEELAKEGIEVVDSTIFLRSLMPGKGLLTPKRKLTKEEREDIKMGLAMAKEIGRLDIGQSVAVKNKAVVAVEALEGTDAMIRRAGEISGGGFILCKTAKPMQDRRFDVPVVGDQTIHSLIAAKGAVLAFEADATLFFNQKEAIDLATQNNIAIVAE